MNPAPWLSPALLLLIVVAAHYQPNAQRSYAAACFVVLTAVHTASLWNWDASTQGLLYYGSAAAKNLLVIALLSAVRPLCSTVILLQRLCLGMILTNFLGYFLWRFYFEATLYNWGFVGLYAAVLFILIKRGRGHARGFGMDRWKSCFRFNHLASLDFMRKIKSEVPE